MNLDDYVKEKEIQDGLVKLFEDAKLDEGKKILRGKSEIFEYLKKSEEIPVLEIKETPEEIETVKEPVSSDDLLSVNIEPEEPINQPIDQEPVDKKYDKFLDDYNDTPEPEPVKDNATRVTLWGGGENNSIVNLGGGIEIYKEKYASDLRIRTISANGLASASLVNDLVVITAEDQFNTYSEIVSAASHDEFHVYQQTTSAYKKINFENLLVSLSGSGEANNGENVGGSNEIFKQKNGVDLQFRTLSAGSNIQIISAADTLTISAISDTNSWPTVSANYYTTTQVNVISSTIKDSIPNLSAGNNIQLTSAGQVVTITMLEPIRIVTSNYNLTTTDTIILVSGGSSNINIVLTSATGSFKQYKIKTIGTGTITVSGNTTNTIDDEYTQPITQWDSINIVDYTTGKWAII
jgi:hypothetical protein